MHTYWLHSKNQRSVGLSVRVSLYVCVCVRARGCCDLVSLVRRLEQLHSVFSILRSGDQNTVSSCSVFCSVQKLNSHSCVHLFCCVGNAIIQHLRMEARNAQGLVSSRVRWAHVQTAAKRTNSTAAETANASLVRLVLRVCLYSCSCSSWALFCVVVVVHGRVIADQYIKTPCGAKTDTVCASTNVVCVSFAC